MHDRRDTKRTGVSLRDGGHNAWTYIGALMDRTRPEAECAPGVWRSAIDAMSQEVAVLDAEGRIVAVNRAWQRFAADNGGDPQSTGIGADYLAATRHARDPIALRVATAIEDMLEGRRQSFEAGYPCDSPDRKRWFAMRADRIDVHGSPHVMTTHTEITDLRRAEHRATVQAHLLDMIAIPVFALDRERRVSYVNRAAEHFWGRPDSALLGRRFVDSGLLDPATFDRGTIGHALRSARRFEGECRAITCSGLRVPVAMSLALMEGSEGQEEGLIGTLVDLTQHYAHRRDLQAARDYLHTITESIADSLLVADGRGKITYCNQAARDSLAAGGPLTGRRIDEILRAAGPDSEEGVAQLLDGSSGAQSGEAVLVTPEGTCVPTEWTVTTLAAGDRPAEHSEGSRVLVLRDATDRHAREARLRRETERLRWTAQIDQAIREDRLEVHAQAIVDLSTRRTVDHELLLRMRDDAGDLLMPYEFLPAAETYGLVTKLDRWVIEEAIACVVAGCPVHVNLSSHSIADEEVLELLTTRIAHTGADPSMLTVELTETALLEHPARASAFATTLRDIGCHIALDDFGAGYNSFARIKGIPADVIKIDRQFAAEVVDDAASESVVKAVLSFAAELGQTVIAEGVEDEHVARHLRQLGVQYAQGYYFGKPEPVRVARSARSVEHPRRRSSARGSEELPGGPRTS